VIKLIGKNNHQSPLPPGDNVGLIIYYQ